MRSIAIIFAAVAVLVGLAFTNNDPGYSKNRTFVPTVNGKPLTQLK